MDDRATASILRVTTAHMRPQRAQTIYKPDVPTSNPESLTRGFALSKFLINRIKISASRLNLG